MKRRVARWGVVIVAVVVLTLCLQGVVTELLVVPLAYLAWRANLLLRSIPQWAYWSLLVAVVALVALVSLVRTLHLGQGVYRGHPPAPGPVGKMARQIRIARRGAYGKWLVARPATGCKVGTGTPQQRCKPTWRPD
jgi:hypothetical protein